MNSDFELTEEEARACVFFILACPHIGDGPEMRIKAISFGQLPRPVADLISWSSTPSSACGSKPARDCRFDNDETGQGMVIPHISIQEVRLINTTTTTSKITLAGAKNPSDVNGIDIGQVVAELISNERSWAVDIISGIQSLFRR